MLELLAGLTITTLLIIGWIRASLFASVFLTLVSLLLMAFSAAIRFDAGFAIGFVVLVLAWMPIVLRLGRVS